MQSIRGIAKQRGITSGKVSKIKLIRMLQSEEGNFDCFAKAYDRFCDQSDCMWREDCLSLSPRQAKDS